MLKVSLPIIKTEATDVRLVDGTGPWEGRLEVNLNGQWGAVCDTGFGDKEAGVICRMLGYTGRSVIQITYIKLVLGILTSLVLT